MDWKTLYRELKVLNWIILGILSVASCVFMRGSVTLGVLLGGLIIIANFGLLQHTVTRAFSLDGNMKKGKASIITKYYLRLLGLGAILYLVITKGVVNPVGLAVGLSTIVFSIVIVGIHRAVRTTNEGAI
jgi:hypothetical protein